MVAQSMSGDANKGDNEVEDLDRGDDRPHGASLPRVQGPRSRSAVLFGANNSVVCGGSSVRKRSF